MTKEAKSNFRNVVTHNVLTSLGSSNKNASIFKKWSKKVIKMIKN